MIIIFSLIYTYLDCIYQLLFCSTVSTKYFINRLFILNKYLLNWSIEVDESDNIEGDRILAMFTHPKILDGVFALKYLTDKYPNHQIIFVIKKELVNIKLIGNYIKNNFLCLERKLEKDEPYIRNRLKYYIDKYPKIVVAIFPEGTTYCNENIIKSNKWCDKNNINYFNNLLCPRKSGIKIINEILKPDVITNNIIYYIDDLYQNKSNYEIDLLKMDTIHRCKIISKKCNKDIDIYKIWRENDKILSDEYKKLKDIHHIINKYNNLNNNLIKNYLILIPFILSLLIIYSIYYINNFFLNILMISGILFYIIGKFCDMYIYNNILSSIII